MVNLIKNKNDMWTVSRGDTIFPNFPSIEAAAAFMVSYFKVKDDEIDEALMEMAGLDRCRAIFNADGELESTVDV